MSAYLSEMGTALYTALSSSAGLITKLGGTAIYANLAPDGINLPYVVFSHSGGGVELLSPQDMRNDVWWIRTYAATAALASEIDACVEIALHKRTLALNSWSNFWCVREDERTTVDIAANGVRIYTHGGIYRIRSSK